MEILVCIAALLGIASAAPNFFFLPQGVAYGVSGSVVPYSAPIHIVPSAPAAAPAAPQKPLLRVVDVQEATQFHSQDGRGQFLFGIPDQARIESRTSDGTVRGSYSYLDPIGRAITVQYIADKSGYHAATNEVHVSAPGVAPVVSRDHNSNVQYYAASAPNLVPASIVGNLPTPVEDTPEVAAAREAHLRLHQAALEAHAAAVAEVEAKEAKEAKEAGEQTPAKDGGGVVDFEEDVGEEVEVEDDAGEVNSDAVSDESDEGVVIESDAIADNSAGAGISSYDDDHELTYEKDRYPKLQYAGQPETYDPARVHDVANNAVIVTNPEFADEGEVASTRTKGAEKQDEGAVVAGAQPGKGAFFYSFRHAVPVFVSIPHEQKHQQILQSRFLGVLGAPGVVSAPGVVRAGTSGQSPAQPLSISERASLLGAVPVAAVHDAQVSPTQRESLKNHQTLPLYIAPAEIEEN